MKFFPKLFKFLPKIETETFEQITKEETEKILILLERRMYQIDQRRDREYVKKENEKLQKLIEKISSGSYISFKGG